MTPRTFPLGLQPLTVAPALNALRMEFGFDPGTPEDFAVLALVIFPYGTQQAVVDTEIVERGEPETEEARFLKAKTALLWRHQGLGPHQRTAFGVVTPDLVGVTVTGENRRLFPDREPGEFDDDVAMLAWPMAQKLEARADKRGRSFTTMTRAECIKFLKGELAELWDAVRDLDNGKGDLDVRRGAVLNECADVGNGLMFLVQQVTRESQAAPIKAVADSIAKHSDPEQRGANA
jgi:hypothetical protein